MAKAWREHLPKNVNSTFVSISQSCSVQVEPNDDSFRSEELEMWADDPTRRCKDAHIKANTLHMPDALWARGANLYLLQLRVEILLRTFRWFHEVAVLCTVTEIPIKPFCDWHGVPLCSTRCFYTLINSICFERSEVLSRSLQNNRVTPLLQLIPIVYIFGE